jgi:uncharacterized protein (DUF697 family)
MATKKAAKRAATKVAAPANGNGNGKRATRDRENLVEVMREHSEGLKKTKDEVRKLAEANLKQGEELMRLLNDPSAQTGQAGPEMRSAGTSMRSDGNLPAGMGQQLADMEQRLLEAMQAARGIAAGTRRSGLAMRAAEDPVAGTDEVTEKLAAAQSVVNLYSIVAGGISFLPGGFGFAAVFTTQVLMLRSIGEVFGQTISNSLATTVVSAALGTAFDAGLAGGVRLLAMSALPVTLGTVVGVIATPAAAIAATQALGRLVVQQFQTAGVLEVSRGFAEHLRSRFPGAYKEELSRKRAA